MTNARVSHASIAEAMADGASALRYRAERLAGLAGDDKAAAECVASFIASAESLEAALGIGPYQRPRND